MSEWSALKLSTVAQLITKGATPTTYGHEYTESGIAFVRVNNILENGQLDLSKSLFIGETTHALFSRSQLNVNDVLVSIAGSIGRTTVVDAAVLPANCNQAVALIRLEPDFDPSYVARLLASNIGRAQITAATVQLAQANFSLRQVGDLEFNFPPHSEQKSIAKVIDCIDMTICRTEAIIEKLKLVKQGLLHDLLTRGIDANGELRPPQSQAPHLYKDSPLGWIPHEWAAASIRDVASLVTSGSRGWADYYTEAGALFLRSQNVRMGNLDFSDRQHVAPPIGAEGARTKLTAFDLLITITGNGVGNVACVPGNWDELAFVSQHVGLVRLRDPQIAQLTMHFFVGGAPGHQQLVDAQYGQSKPGLSLENLRKFSIPIPPDEERQMIIQRIHGAQDRGDVEQRYAMQLRAMKEGLMDDLLTGRVRVTPLLDTVDAKR
jgi:type I restriction enzyme S subunit